jgi:DNA (cytosine-5)-methyltransferase 1
MNNELIILDLFAGIGGFSEGFLRAGYPIKKHYFSEIDKHAIACYKHNFKNSEYVGSVTTLDGKSIERPNIITFGSPCQDFSLAGKRAGMEGERSSLIREAIRLVTECRPDVFIWENVKGAFSSNNGADFWGIIQAFANIGGYRLEWQLLNTAWVLPQNRERIYLIGHLANGRSRQVFPITESDFRINERSTGTAIVRTLTAGGHSGGMHSSMTLVSCAASRGHNPENLSDRIPGQYNEQTLEIRNDSNTNTLTSVGKDNLVVIQKTSGQSVTVKNNCTGTLQAGGANVMDKVPNVVITHYGHKDKPATEHDIVPTLKAQSHGHEPMVMQINQSTESGGKQPYQQNRVYDVNGLMPALSSLKDNNVSITEHRRQSKEVRTYTENSPTITSKFGTGGGNIPFVNNIRRLTEIECEKLQGFDPDWTAFGDYDGIVKPIASTQRYKLVGNAVTVDIVELIARKLNQNNSL